MIYIITTETFPHGLAATQRIKCYAKSITELGKKCKVICMNRCEDVNIPLGNTESHGYIDGYEFCYIGNSTLKSTHRWINYVYRMIDTLKLVVKLLKEFKSNDSVIFYSYNSFLLDILIVFSKIKGFKLYYEINEHPSIQLKNFHIDDENSDHLKNLYKRFRKIDGFLCISSAIQNLLVRCGIPKEKTHIINMVVDSTRFEGLVKQETEPYIAYCGAADNNKDGVDQLIKAFAKISECNERVKLYIMGPKRVDCSNEELAKSLGISDKVIFTGMINSSILPQMLINATIVALNRPDGRQARYGFPTKLGEYLLSGNPVVITSVGDIPLFLENGITAYLAKPNDIDDFADKLNMAIRDLKNGLNIGERGKREALKCFSHERVKQQLRKALKI